ncbi:MAG TPA: OmpA family protein [Polyangiaceae bacterium]|nr:OmpA family protein [Polyangiaceae bacterium]
MRTTARRTTPPLLLAALAGLAAPASAQTPSPTPAAPPPGAAAGPGAAASADAGPGAAASAGAGAGAAASADAGLAASSAAPGGEAGFLRRDPSAEGLYAAPTLTGSTGLVRVASAMLPPAGTFRLQVLYEYFKASGFLCTRERLCTSTIGSDRTTRAGFAFAGSAAVTDFLEAYLALRSYSTDNSLGNPSLLQTLGDLTLGAKAALPYRPGRLLHAGGDLQLSLVQGTGGVGLDTSALGGRLRGDATLDLRATGPRLPLLVHLNLGYRLDNSGAVVEDVEANRGRPVSRIERYGLGVSRVDSFEAGLGVEALFAPGGGVRSLRPFVEYTLDAPVNRQGYTCAPARSAPGDQCLGNSSGLRSTPSRLTLGARANPWLKGLTATLAFDVGVSGTSLFLEEVVPQAPWTLWLGVGYAFDPNDRSPPQLVVVSDPANPRYVVEGFVHEARAQAAVGEAIVHLEGGDGTGLLTDASGRFRTAPLAPGSYHFRVQARGYYDAVCDVRVASTAGAGRGAEPPAVRADCPLEALPRSGTLRGRVHSGTEGGPPVAGATVIITDSAGAEHQATTDATGAFRLESLPPGPTRLRVSQGTHFDASALADVKPREVASVSVALHRRPATPSVSVGKKELGLKRQVHFETNSATILPDSGTLLEEIADVLKKNPRLKRVEIQGHTDSQGQPARNRTLSQERADAVRERLVSLGVAPERLTAKGYGDERPVVPNITAANRARNRRVALVIVEQDPDTGAP